MKTKVSIITPTYNLEKYIDQCIESVLKQTYQNWEMIIIDDCSSDNTYNIITKYAQKDKRIRVFQHKKRWGVNKLVFTYNQALKKTKGSLIAILEGDDFWPNNKLEKQVPTFKDKNIVLSYGNGIVTKADGTPIQIVTYNKDHSILYNNPPGAILRGFLDLDFYLEAETVMVRKSSLIELGGFINESYPSFVDFPTWFALSTKGAFYYKKEILGYYRKHKGSFWFAMAKKSFAMGRREIQQCLIATILKYKKELQKHNTFISKYKIKKTQDAFIKKKSKNRDISIILHYLAFNERKEAQEYVFRVLKSEKTTVTKIKALFILACVLSHIDILSLSFNLQFLFYKIRHLRRHST